MIWIALACLAALVLCFVYALCRTSTRADFYSHNNDTETTELTRKLMRKALNRGSK